MDKVVFKVGSANKLNEKFNSKKKTIWLQDSYGGSLERIEKQKKRKFDSISKATWDFFIDDYANFGYEAREGQQNMALDIVDALKDGEHIVVEAGVGIGKSFGYLVPIIYMHQEYYKPIVVATSTIALQEQLAEDIKTVCDKLSYPIEVVFAKGQNHFLCRNRASNYLSDPKIHKLAGLNYEERKNVPFKIDDQVWNKINVEYNFKDCNICEFKDQCYYFELRNKMLHTNGIILCNQDLLIAHLKKIQASQRPLLNKEIMVKVIDEAHNLEEKVRSASTVSYGQNTIKEVLSQIEKNMRVEGSNLHHVTESVMKSVEGLFRELGKQIRRQIEDSENYINDSERYFLAVNDIVEMYLSKLMEGIKKLEDFIGLHFNDERATESEQQAVENFEDFYTFIDSLNDRQENLLWLTYRKQKAEIYACPKNIDEMSRRLFFKDQTPTILTSATLTNQKTGNDEEKYRYFIKNIGFPQNDGGFISEPKPSPFPYDEHSKIYYASCLPHPSDQRQEFIVEGTEIVANLLEMTNGKALILFTAKTDMEAVYEILKQKNLPYKIMMQNSESSQEQLLATFRMDMNSVLLGTGVFWEGINIEGESLSNLIIFRLPFPVPDPIIEYKCSIANDRLADVLVPEMIIKLNQGIGRLIRSSYDKGIVSIIDPRLGNQYRSNYKDTVWASLPIQNRTDSLGELKDFFCRINK